MDRIGHEAVAPFAHLHSDDAYVIYSSGTFVDGTAMFITRVETYHVGDIQRYTSYQQAGRVPTNTEVRKSIIITENNWPSAFTHFQHTWVI